MEASRGYDMGVRAADRLQITGAQLWRDHLVGMVVITVTVTVIFVLRCYARQTSGTRLLLEDWTCTIAWAMLMLYCATVFVMIGNGEGHHIWELSHRQYTNILMWLYGSSIVYIPAAYVTKVTLLLLITRVFAVRRRVVQGIHAFMALLLVAYLPIQIMKTAVCVPIRAYWEGKTTVPGARCLNQRQLFISDLALAIITDTVVLFVPIPLTWTLRVSRRRKMKIVALLGAGGCAMAVTIYRMYKVIVFLNTTDLPFDFALIDLLTTLEISIGLICACLPSVNLLIERSLLDRRQKASSQSSSFWGSPRSPNSPRTMDSGFSSRLRKLKRDSGKFLSSSLGRTTLFSTQSSPSDKTETWTRAGTVFSEESGLARPHDDQPQEGGHSHAGAHSHGNVESTGCCMDGSINGNASILFGADDADNIDLDVEKQMASGKPIVMPPRGDGLLPVSAPLSSSGILSSLAQQAAAQSGSIVNVSVGTGSPSARAASVETSGSGGILKTVQVIFAGQPGADNMMMDPSGPSQQRHQPRPPHHHDHRPDEPQNYPGQIRIPSPDRIWDGTGSRPPFHRMHT